MFISLGSNARKVSRQRIWGIYLNENSGKIYYHISTTTTVLGVYQKIKKVQKSSFRKFHFSIIPIGYKHAKSYLKHIFITPKALSFYKAIGLKILSQPDSNVNHYPKISLIWVDCKKTSQTQQIAWLDPTRLKMTPRKQKIESQQTKIARNTQKG